MGQSVSQNIEKALQPLKNEEQPNMAKEKFPPEVGAEIKHDYLKAKGADKGEPVQAKPALSDLLQQSDRRYIDNVVSNKGVFDPTAFVSTASRGIATSSAVRQQQEMVTQLSLEQGVEKGKKSKRGVAEERELEQFLAGIITPRQIQELVKLVEKSRTDVGTGLQTTREDMLNLAKDVARKLEGAMQGAELFIPKDQLQKGLEKLLKDLPEKERIAFSEDVTKLIGAKAEASKAFSLDSLSPEQIQAILKDIEGEVVIPDEMKYRLERLADVKAILDEEVACVEDPKSPGGRFAAFKTRLHDLVGVRDRADEQRYAYKLDIHRFMNLDWDKVTARYLAGESFDKIVPQYPLLHEVLKERDFNLAEIKNSDDLLREKINLIEYYRLKRDLPAAEMLTHELLAPHFEKAIKLMPPERRAAINLQAREEADALVERFKDGWKNPSAEMRSQGAQAFSDKEILKIRDRLMFERVKLYRTREAAKYIDQDKLTPAERELWAVYNDAFNPKGEITNPSDAMWDTAIEETLVNLPLIVVSWGSSLVVEAGARQVAKKGAQMLGTRLLGMEAMQAVSTKLGSSLVVRGLSSSASMLIEGAVFETVFSGLHGDWIGGMPNWGLQILWSSATFGMLRGASRIGTRAFEKTVLENGVEVTKPVLLGRFTSKITQPTVRAAAEQLLFKGHIEAASMLVMGAAQNGFYNGDIGEFSKHFGVDLINAYVTIGAIKLTDAGFRTASGRVLEVKPERVIGEVQKGGPVAEVPKAERVTAKDSHLVERAEVSQREPPLREESKAKTPEHPDIERLRAEIDRLARDAKDPKYSEGAKREILERRKEAVRELGSLLKETPKGETANRTAEESSKDSGDSDFEWGGDWSPGGPRGGDAPRSPNFGGGGGGVALAPERTKVTLRSEPQTPFVEVKPQAKTSTEGKVLDDIGVKLTPAESKIADDLLREALSTPKVEPPRIDPNIKLRVPPEAPATALREELALIAKPETPSVRVNALPEQNTRPLVDLPPTGQILDEEPDQLLARWIERVEVKDSVPSVNYETELALDAPELKPALEVKPLEERKIGATEEASELKIAPWKEDKVEFAAPLATQESVTILPERVKLEEKERSFVRELEIRDAPLDSSESKPFDIGVNINSRLNSEITLRLPSEEEELETSPLIEVPLYQRAVVADGATRLELSPKSAASGEESSGEEATKSAAHPIVSTKQREETAPASEPKKKSASRTLTETATKTRDEPVDPTPFKSNEDEARKRSEDKWRINPLDIRKVRSSKTNIKSGRRKKIYENEEQDGLAETDPNSHRYRVDQKES